MTAPRRYIVHFGFNNQPETNLVRRYAERQGCEYRWEGLKNDIFQAASVIKFASMAVIWNGLQHGTPLVTRLCRRRGIPVCYVEWGLLPQADTFSIDPAGFCGDSILARDVSWVTEADMARLHQVRAELQQRYPRQRGAHVLAVLQIENDTQTLYFSPLRNMEEFVADIEAMYPTERIVARPHPKSNAKRTFARAEVEAGGDFLEAASKAVILCIYSVITPSSASAIPQLIYIYIIHYRLCLCIPMPLNSCHERFTLYTLLIRVGKGVVAALPSPVSPNPFNPMRHRCSATIHRRCCVGMRKQWPSFVSLSV